MPIRIRKSFNLFPGVKVNVSKGGTSLTVGKKGFHLNFSKRGVRETVGLPGSGISETNYLYKKNSDDKEKRKEENIAEAENKPMRSVRGRSRERVSSPLGFFLFVVIALCIIYFGGNALGLLPPNLLTNFLQSLAHLAKQAGM